MITQTVEYALRAMVVLARGDPQLQSSREISKVIDVAPPYLSKVMQSLVRSGLVRSRRGIHGGFSITKDPHVLTVWDVIEAVEPIKRIRKCPLDISAHSDQLCPLHKRLDEALEHVEKVFRETTLAELVSHGDSVSPLCPPAEQRVQQ